MFLFCSDYGNDADEPARVILEVTMCDKVLWIPVIWLTTSSYCTHLYKFVLFQYTHPIHHYHSSNGYGNQGQPMASEVALFNYQPLNPPSWGMYSTNVPVIPIKCLLLRVTNHDTSPNLYPSVKSVKCRHLLPLKTPMVHFQ